MKVAANLKVEAKGCGKFNETIERDHKAKDNDPHFEPQLCIQSGAYTGTWVIWPPFCILCPCRAEKYTRLHLVKRIKWQRGL